MEATRLNMGTHWNACMSKICRQSLQRQRGSTFTSLPLHFHHFHHLCGCEASHVAVTIHNLCSYNYVHLKNSRNLISLHTGHIFNFMPLSNSMIVWLLVSAMHLYGLLCPTYNAPQMGRLVKFYMNIIRVECFSYWVPSYSLTVIVSTDWRRFLVKWHETSIGWLHFSLSIANLIPWLTSLAD